MNLVDTLESSNSSLKSSKEAVEDNDETVVRYSNCEMENKESLLQRGDGISGPLEDILLGKSHKTITHYLNARKGKPLFTLKHDVCVTTVAVSPNGNTIVSGDAEGIVYMWNTNTEQSGDEMLFRGYDDHVSSLSGTTEGISLNRLEGHTDQITVVKFSHDGTTLLTGSRDKTVCLWNASTGFFLTVLKGHNGLISSAVFSRDGQTVLIGSHDKKVSLWDSKSGKLRRVLRGHTGPVTSVEFGLDEKTVISSSEDKTVCVWDITVDENMMLSSNLIDQMNEDSEESCCCICCSCCDESSCCSVQ